MKKSTSHTFGESAVTKVTVVVMLRTASANEKHSTAHQSHTQSTFCHGRWFINAAAAAAAAAVVVFHHIYFVCVFRLIILLDLVFYYFIIFSYFVAAPFTLVSPFMCSGFAVCFARIHSTFFTVWSWIFIHTRFVAGIPFFMLRMSVFF